MSGISLRKLIMINDASRLEVKNELPVFTGQNLSVKELIFLLFSKTSVYCSVTSITDNIKPKFLWFFTTNKFTKIISDKIGYKHCKLLDERQPNYKYTSHWENNSVKEENTMYVSKIKQLLDVKKFNLKFYVCLQTKIERKFYYDYDRKSNGI